LYIVVIFNNGCLVMFQNTCFICKLINLNKNQHKIL
jgi:hypothetical protein